MTTSHVVSDRVSQPGQRADLGARCHWSPSHVHRPSGVVPTGGLPKERPSMAARFDESIIV
jgi:hypothetical protein